jgi:hypothetical protein
MTRGTHITVPVSLLVQFSKFQHSLTNALSYVTLHNSLAGFSEDVCEQIKMPGTTSQIQVTVFWDVIQYRLVNMHQRFGGIGNLHLQGAGVKDYYVIPNTAISSTLKR